MRLYIICTRNEDVIKTYCVLRENAVTLFINEFTKLLKYPKARKVLCLDEPQNITALNS